ncbi:MAG: hypothetical protein V4641_16455 [Pseudomonadota bacterium]
MAKVIKYQGIIQNWSELPVTGKPATWRISQQEERENAEADLLLNTRLFTEIVAANRLAGVGKISGDFSVGGKVNCSLPWGFTGNFQWTRTLRASPYTKSNIANASASNVNGLDYTLVAGDATLYNIDCDITAIVQKVAGSQQASAAAPIVAVAPAVISPPAIVGGATVGTALNVTAGVFSGVPTPSVIRSFRLNSTTVATASSYALQVADVGKTLVVREVASNSAGDITSDSAGVVVVASGGTGVAPAVTSAAAITGTPQQGVALSITAAVFSGSPTPTVTRVIKMDGATVATGDQATGYTPVLADVGKIPSVSDTASNGVGSSVTSTAAGSAVIAAASGVTPPVFTAAPTLPNLPTAGTALTAVAGTYTGTATTDTLTILKLTNDGWQDVGQGYVPTVRDLQLRFIASHTASNAGGTDIATSVSKPGVQTVGLQPSFNQSTDPANATTNVTGENVNPHFMADQVPVGFRVKLYLGKTTAGAVVTPTVLAETGVGTGVYAASAGTLATATGANPYTYYVPAAGEAGRRLVIDANLTGTGSNAQPTFRSDPVMVVAAAAATGKVRSVAVHNRLPLQFSTNPDGSGNGNLVSNNVARRVLSNMKRVVGSGPVTSFVPIVSNLLDTGPTGFQMRITGADAVYNGVVVPLKVSNVAATEGAPLLVPNGGKLVFDEVLATAFGALNHMPAGEGPLFRMKTDVPVGNIIGCGEGLDIPGPAEHIWIEAADTIVNDIGNTNAGNNYLLSASGSTVGTKAQGPLMQIMGKFACGDPKVVISTRDSKGALPGSGGFHFSLTTFIPGKAPLAGLLIARSGTNTGMITSSAELQSYFAYGWIYINGYGVNAIGDTANVGNARGLDTASADIWALMKANAITGTGVHAPVVIQTGIDYHFRPNNTNPSTTFVTTLSSRQTPFTPFDVGGDVTVHFVNAMKAAVQAGTIAAYVDHRDVYSLSSDPTSPLYLKVKQSWFSDQLHPGDAIPGARVGRKVVDAIV